MLSLRAVKVKEKMMVVYSFVALADKLNSLRLTCKPHTSKSHSFYLQIVLND